MGAASVAEHGRVPRPARIWIGAIGATTQAVVALAGAGVAFSQAELMSHTPDSSLLGLLFGFWMLVLLIAMLICLLVAFLSTRRRRGWRIAAAAADSVVAAIFVTAILGGAVAYAGRRPTDFQPDPGLWPLLLLVCVLLLWLLGWATVLVAAIRNA